MNKEIRELVLNFDHSYEMSDDPRWYHAGANATARLKELLAGSTRKEVREVAALWNKTVKQKWIDPSIYAWDNKYWIGSWSKRKLMRNVKRLR
jgi:hypothetical protein